MSEELIQALQNPTLYPHAVSGFEVLQTHLSWVILTGQFAYKIKKPLNLGFQDFTTLQKRKYYCELEVQLNKRLAPQIYIEAIPITGTMSKPSLSGNGEVIEYAVKMNQFDQSALLGNMVKKGALTTQIIENLAEQTALFHLDAAVCSPHRAFGLPSEVFQPIQDNFSALKTLPGAFAYRDIVKHIEIWAIKQYHSLQTLLTSRKKEGFIRSCHGDFHLGNMVLLEGKSVLFDCIEFNEHFRWTDVMNDIAFLAMDLDHYQLPWFSHLFVNKYLEHTGDYQGAALLRFYQSYRAMVRAKVSALQLDQLSNQDIKSTSLQQDLKNYLSLAELYSQSHEKSLTLTFGLSGSGKTLYTEHLLMQTGAIRLRSDVIRKQMQGLPPDEPTPENKKQSLYSVDATEKLYFRLQDLAKELLQAGLSVIVDATFLCHWQRQLFFDLANDLNVHINILSFEAPIEVLKQRVLLRQKVGKDASDADVSIVELQHSNMEPLTEYEKTVTTVLHQKEIDKLIKDLNLQP
ncbi:MAG: AAA family ATPase [Gammaproteobacteria bacterium]|jgi:aminoglycoside phosphotransferase family enzyme|nr:AAA family ATPase [Gammaproteobacteria bacterium]